MTPDPIAQQLGRRGWESYTATCQQCGQAFVAKRRIKTGRETARYCSASHRQLAFAARKRATRTPAAASGA